MLWVIWYLFVWSHRKYQWPPRTAVAAELQHTDSSYTGVCSVQKVTTPLGHCWSHFSYSPDSKVHGTNTGSIWGRLPMLALWTLLSGSMPWGRTCKIDSWRHTSCYLLNHGYWRSHQLHDLPHFWCHNNCMKSIISMYFIDIHADYRICI